MFGDDPGGYDQARPDYPDRLYQILVERCGVGPGACAFEVGPGPGRFTERLLALGITYLAAVEPDARLADFLRERLGDSAAAVKIENSSFEEVDLPPASFDLGVAATSFHWLEAETALPKALQLLRPGGCWAMWWNVYADAAENDPFARATDDLFKDLSHTPSYGGVLRQAYGLDVPLRERDLTAAGFVDIEHEAIHWRKTMSSDEIVALTATFSSVRLLPAVQNTEFLSRLRTIVDTQFGGAVDRGFVTPVYTARRPK